MVAPSFVTKMIELSNGSQRDQINGVAKIYKKIFRNGLCVDLNALTKLFPAFINFLNSANLESQQEAAFYIMSMANPPISPTATAAKRADAAAVGKDNAKIIIEKGVVVPRLLELLTSPHPAVVQQCLSCLENLSTDHPEKVLPPLVKFLKTQDEDIPSGAIQVLKNLFDDCKNNAPFIVRNGCVKELVKLLESVNRDIIEFVMDTLINIISYNADCCGAVIDCGALKLIKRYLFNRVITIRFKVVDFIKELVKHGKKEIDIAIKEGFIKFVIRELKSADSIDEDKIRMVNILQCVFPHNSAYLTDKENVIPVFIKYLQNSDDELVIAVLSALEAAIKVAGYKTIEKKLQKCGGKTKLRSLLQHENSDIKQLYVTLNKYFGNGPKERNNTNERSDSDDSTEEESEETDGSSRNGSRRKRRTAAKNAAQNKRRRTSDM